MHRQHKKIAMIYKMETFPFINLLKILTTFVTF